MDKSGLPRRIKWRRTVNEMDLYGENIPSLLPGSRLPEPEPPKRGRPVEVAIERLNSNAGELSFVLEQCWGDVGWGLWQAKQICDVREAFSKVVHYRCGLLEPFKQSQTRATSAKELRSLRSKTKALNLNCRELYRDWQITQNEHELIERACATEADPVKKAQVLPMIRDSASAVQQTEMRREINRAKLEELESELKEREAYFAQAEILRFIQSNRRKFTPVNIACAMAGLPILTARVSREKCAAHCIEPLPGHAFAMFQIMRRGVERYPRNPEFWLESMKAVLLTGPESKTSHASELRDNWYFLERAIRIAAQERDSPPQSVPYRVFSEYTKASKRQSLADSVLASINKLSLGMC